MEEKLVVRSEADEILLGLLGGWTERLKREEAWEFAEAIDLVSTAGSDSDDNSTSGTPD